MRHLFAYQPGTRVKQQFARRNRIESCRVDSDGDRARVERLTTTAATLRSAMSTPGGGCRGELTAFPMKFKAV